MQFSHHIHAKLERLEAAGLSRRARDVSGPQGPELTVDGRRVVCLCSNNYLGLANHPELVAAAASSAERDGFGAAASRLISGTMDAHRSAETAFAHFLGRPAAALFSSGYAANVGVLQALVGPDDVLFSDRLNHASLIDGARLSRARVVIYDHADPTDLARKLASQRHAGAAALVVTESLFSMDGDSPPLPAIARLCREYDAGLLVDEAHALGVFGPAGRGLCAAQGVEPDVLVGTLGKAFGAQGAFVAASEDTVRLIRNRARSYVFSTAPAAPAARAAVAALRLVERATASRARLLSHAARLRQALRELGYRVPAGNTQIIPLLVGDPAPTMALSAALLDAGVFAHGIRPPTVPQGTGRLRVVPMATHTDSHIDRAIEAFRALAP